MARDEDRSEDLPQSLIEGLKAADRPVPMITARVDRELSELARSHFSTRRQPARFGRSGWAALAATVLIALFVAQFRASGPDQGELYTDVDQSGRIDIADVLALARSQKQGERSQAELDAFAARIVSLEAGDEVS